MPMAAAASLNVPDWAEMRMSRAPLLLDLNYNQFVQHLARSSEVVQNRHHRTQRQVFCF